MHTLYQVIKKKKQKDCSILFVFSLAVKFHLLYKISGAQFLENNISSNQR